MIKVYGIHGRTTAHLRIPVGKSGKAFLECEFSRGRMGVGPATRPAEYVTSDPVKQAIIESSPLFGQSIKLLRSHSEESDAQAVAPEQNVRAAVVSTQASAAPAEGVQECLDYPDIKTRDEALAFLKAHGAKAVNLKDDNAIKKFMAKIHVSFSNLPF